MTPTVTAVIAVAALVVGTIGAALHFIAPRTKTTLDDRWAARFDALEELLKNLIKPAAILLVVMLFGAAVSLQACAWLKSTGGDVASAAKDCATPTERAAVKALAPAVDAIIVEHADPNGKIDWAPIGDVLKGLTVEYGGCVLAEVVANEIKPKPADPNAPKSAELVLDRQSLRRGFDMIRASQFGGATFKLAGGGTL